MIEKVERIKRKIRRKGGNGKGVREERITLMSKMGEGEGEGGQCCLVDPP